ncbi:Protein SULP-6 [Aphelenchoides avenae]|nr:Protein SULP-6 [Aphelenchus avenae]
MRKVKDSFKRVGKWTAWDWLRFFRNRVPITEWIVDYDWKESIMKDVTGGLMIAIMSIPQGLAYGLMAGLEAPFGLYTAIFGALVYACMGTSRHVSVGGFAIIALMVGNVVQEVQEKRLNANSSLPVVQSDYLCCQEAHSEDARDGQQEEALRIVVCLTMAAGIVQVLFGLLNAGVLAVWLSDHLVQGLTSGAAIHVVSSQLKTMTGIKPLPPTSERFGLAKFYICFFCYITEIKLQTALCSIIGCAFLIFSKELVDPVIGKYIKVKFPMELLVVVFSTLLAYLSAGTVWDLKLDVVGPVKKGMQTPIVPDLSQIGDMVNPMFSVAILSFVIHIALAKLVSKKLSYQIDPNQACEWLALGMLHIISSFFGCFAGGSSMSRTMTQVRLGTKSQLSSIACALVLIAVVYGAADWFHYLPKPILSCIIVVALKDLLAQIWDARLLFERSFLDFMIWFVTFLAVVLINVNEGMIIGIAFALLTVVFRSQWAESNCMARIRGTSDFKGVGQYRLSDEIPGMKVFRFDAPLYFANAELFLNELHEASGLNPVEILRKLEAAAARKKKRDDTAHEQEKESKANKSQQQVDSSNSSTPDGQPSGDVELVMRKRNPNSKEKAELHDAADDMKPLLDEPQQMNDDFIQLTHLIIDCSSFPYIDLMGMDALALAYQEYQDIGIHVFFAHCKVAVRQFFEEAGFYQKVPKSTMFVSVNDAVSYALSENLDKQNKAGNDAQSVTINEHSPTHTDRLPSTHAQILSLSPPSEHTARE